MSTSSIPVRPTAHLRTRSKTATVVLAALILGLAIVSAGAWNGTSANADGLDPSGRQVTFSTDPFSPAAQSTPTALTPTSPLARAPSVGWNLFFSDRFEANANGWNVGNQQPYSDDYGFFNEQIGAGTFRIDVRATKSVAAKYWPNLKAMEDVSVSVQARRVNGPTNAVYGLFLHKDNQGNYYLFGARDDRQFGVFLFKGQWTTLIDWTQTDAIQPGAVNRLTATSQGGRITFSINDRQVGEVKNNEVPSGLVGFLFELFNAGDQASFEYSNFEASVPTSSPGLNPVAPTPGASGANIPSNWAVILSEQFLSNSNNWGITAQQPDTNDFGTFYEQIGNGKLRIEANVTKSVSIKWWPTMQPVSDLALTADAQLLDGSSDETGYGLVFRKDSNNNQYIFVISGTRDFKVARFSGGQWTTLINWTQSSAIQPNGVNRLGVVAQGAHFTFSINGQQVGQVDDTVIKNGFVGVALDMDAGVQGTVEFSTFELRAPSAGPAPAAPTSSGITRSGTATPTSHAATPATATGIPSSWQVLLSDKFSSNTNNWNIPTQQPESNEYGTFSERIGNGALRFEGNSPKGVVYKFWPSLPTLTDQAVSVDVQHISGTRPASAGLFFRKDSDNNYYMLELSGDGRATVALHYQDEWTDLIQINGGSAIRVGAVNRLTAVAQGSRLTFYINGQQIGQVNNDSVESGVAGIVVDLDTNQQAVFEFSNFEVRGP